MAVGLILSTVAFAQSQQSNNYGNDHGQNDCQCTGTGLQTPHKTSLMKVAPPSDRKNIEAHNLWLTYIKMYWAQLHNPINRRNGN